MKKLFVFALLVLGVVFFIRFLTPEDTWIKVGSKWIQHGKPSAPSPENKIQKFGSTEELRAFLEENQNVQGGGYGGGMRATSDMVVSQEKSLSAPNAAQHAWTTRPRMHRWNSVKKKGTFDYGQHNTITEIHHRR